VTTAGIFPGIERYRPTMLIDEADTFIDAGDEMAGILNSGHQPETAFVWRCDGDDHEPRGFSTWSPLAIARIGDDLPAPLRSRSIVIRMQRARCDEDLERLRAMHHAGLDDLCRKGARWAVDHLDVLRDADPEMPEALRGRSADNWRPLISIADAAGGCWADTARRVAVIMIGRDEESKPVRLLAAIRDVFAAKRVDTASAVSTLSTPPLLMSVSYRSTASSKSPLSLSSGGSASSLYVMWNATAGS
jgi:putative DNA primase/helicase